MMVYVDACHDRFKLISGFGANQHAGHPRLKINEVQPLLSSAPEEEHQLQHDLGAAAAPTCVRQRFMAKRTSLHYSKHAMSKTSQLNSIFD